MSIYSKHSPDQSTNPFANFSHIRIGRVIAIYPRSGTVKVKLLNSSYYLEYYEHSNSVGEVHATVLADIHGWDGQSGDENGKGNWLSTKKQWRYGKVRFPRKGDYVAVGFINSIAMFPVVLGSIPTLPNILYESPKYWWITKPKGKVSKYSILDSIENYKKYEQTGGESYDKWLEVHPSQVYTKLDWKKQSTDNEFQYEWSHPYGKQDNNRIYDGVKFLISSGDDNESLTDESEKELLTERFRWEDYDSNRHPDPVFIKYTHVDRLKPPWVKLKAILKKSTEWFITRINSVLQDYFFIQVNDPDKDNNNINEFHIERKHYDNIHKVQIFIRGDTTNVEIIRYNGSKYHYFLMKDNEYYLKHENNQYVKMIDKDIIIDALPPEGDVYIKGVNVFVSATNSFDTTTTPNSWIRHDVHTPDDVTTDGATYV